MNVEQSLFRFIDFYLSSMLPSKNIDLIKNKIELRAKKTDDALYHEVCLIKQTLKSLKPYARTTNAGRSNRQTQPERLYSEVRRLKLQDCLILLSGEVFPIPETQLSLALKISPESIRFRRDQLIHYFEDESLPYTHLKRQIDAPIIAPPELTFTEEHATLLQRFHRLPMAVRFLIETGLVLVGLLALLWIIPEIRNRYETSIQKRINDYLIESSLVDSPAPSGTSKTPVLHPEPESVTPADDDESGALKSSSSDDLSSRKQPKVNEGETWRFSFTGSATPDIETAVGAAVQKLNIGSPKSTTVPGGIQYDFMLPVNRVLDLKGYLEQSVSDIQQHGGTKSAATNLASFSWYKKQNMVMNTSVRKVPAGHVLVVIWISTL